MSSIEEDLKAFEGDVYFGAAHAHRRPLPKLPAHTEELQARLQQLGDMRWEAQIDIDGMLPHIAYVIEFAPYLTSASSRSLLTPLDPRHIRLREAWARAMPRLLESPHALLHACEFYLGWNPIEAGRMIDAALSLAPRDSLVMQCAGEYFFQGADMGWKGCTYDLALDHLELARNLSILSPPAMYIGQTAMAALEADCENRAIELAEIGLVPDPVFGHENLHVSHCVLGRIALRRSDIEGALERLKASHQGSWWRWGPSLRLARELAIAGHQESVRSFLCAVREWKGQRPDGIVEGWLAALDASDFDKLRNPGR